MCRQKKRVAKKGTEVGRILICFWWGACRPFGQTGYMGHTEGAAMRLHGAEREETGQQGRLVGEINSGIWALLHLRKQDAK